MRSVVFALSLSLLASILPAFAQSGGAAGKEIRIVGCVQWGKQYRKDGTGIGVGNEFVLTMVKPEGGRKASAYSITGDREKELGRRIGQQVEVIGIIEEEGKPDADRFGDLPRINMTAWVPVKDSCTQ